jgi:hypothetical protein
MNLVGMYMCLLFFKLKNNLNEYYFILNTSFNLMEHLDIPFMCALIIKHC